MNEKRLTIKMGLSSFLGYYAGTTIYSLLSMNNSLPNNNLRYLSGFIASVIIGGAYYLYIRKKYPKFLKEMQAETQDERGQLIQGKASTYTLILATIMAAGLHVYSILKGYEVISLMIGASYILGLIFYIAVNNYLSKRI